MVFPVANGWETHKNLPLWGEQQLETVANTSQAEEQKEESTRGGARVRLAHWWGNRLPRWWSVASLRGWSTTLGLKGSLLELQRTHARRTKLYWAPQRIIFNAYGFYLWGLGISSDCNAEDIIVFGLADCHSRASSSTSTDAHLLPPPTIHQDDANWRISRSYCRMRLYQQTMEDINIA